jgi:hypothetical protein
MILGKIKLSKGGTKQVQNYDYALGKWHEVAWCLVTKTLDPHP